MRGDRLFHDPLPYTDEDHMRLVAEAEITAAMTLEPLSPTGDTPTAARRDFGEAAGNLSGKTMPVGGTWTTSGSATDFAVEASGHTLQRSTTSEASFRFAIAGTATFTNVLAQVDFKVSAIPDLGDSRRAVVVRYVDSSNYLAIFASTVDDGSSLYTHVQSQVTIAGATTGESVAYPIAADGWYTLRLVADVQGRYYGWVFPRGGRAAGPAFARQLTDLATGGTLASGKVGIYDWHSPGTACTRTYDNFLAAVPLTNEVLHSGRQLHVRSDGAIHQDSTGTYSGNWPVYGDYPKIPPAGAENRTTRIAARALRNNPEEMAVPNVTDALAVQAVIQPRYLVPR
jgi:hypothetical protein